LWNFYFQLLIVYVKRWKFSLWKLFDEILLFRVCFLQIIIILVSEISRSLIRIYRMKFLWLVIREINIFFQGKFQDATIFVFSWLASFNKIDQHLTWIIVFISILIIYIFDLLVLINYLYFISLFFTLLITCCSQAWGVLIFSLNSVAETLKWEIYFLINIPLTFLIFRLIGIFLNLIKIIIISGGFINL
jgi:hypothetical protein